MYTYDFPGTGGKIRIESDEELTFKPSTIEGIIERVRYRVGDRVIVAGEGATARYHGRVVNYAVDIRYGIAWDGGVYSVLPDKRIEPEPPAVAPRVAREDG
jgi:hypothetical protein